MNKGLLDPKELENMPRTLRAVYLLGKMLCRMESTHVAHAHLNQNMKNASRRMISYGSKENSDSGLETAEGRPFVDGVGRQMFLSRRLFPQVGSPWLLRFKRIRSS
jgi:hypothetical protein